MSLIAGGSDMRDSIASAGSVIDWLTAVAKTLPNGGCCAGECEEGFCGGDCCKAFGGRGDSIIPRSWSLLNGRMSSARRMRLWWRGSADAPTVKCADSIGGACIMRRRGREHDIATKRIAMTHGAAVEHFGVGRKPRDPEPCRRLPPPPIS